MYGNAWGFDEASIRVSSCFRGCSLFFHLAEIAVSLYLACLMFQPLPCRSLVYSSLKLGDRRKPFVLRKETPMQSRSAVPALPGTRPEFYQTAYVGPHSHWLHQSGLASTSSPEYFSNTCRTRPRETSCFPETCFPTKKHLRLHPNDLPLHKQRPIDSHCHGHCTAKRPVLSRIHRHQLWMGPFPQQLHRHLWLFGFRGRRSIDATGR